MTSPFKWILIQCTAKQTSLAGALTDRDIFSTKLVNYWIFQDNIFSIKMRSGIRHDLKLKQWHQQYQLAKINKT